MADFLRHVCVMSEQVNDGKLGLVPCVAMIVGGMIGSAIFSLSGLTMYNAGPAAIVSWLLAALVMLIYGLIVAELSSIFPKSGGVYVFPSKALGKIWGWISCWGYIMSNIVAIAFAAIYVSTYLGVSFPAFADLQVPLAVAAVAVCLVLNMINFSTAGKINTILVALLAVTLGIYICVSLFGGSWDASLLVPFFGQGAGGPTGFLSVVPTAMVGYGSIVAIAFMVSEVRNPNKTVPKAVLIAMIVVVCLYGLTILATVGLVSSQFLAENPGMRYIPLYAACFTKLAAFPWLAKVVSIAAVLALITTMLVVIALSSRAIHAAAEDGILPAKLAQVSKTGSPILPAIIVAIVSAIVACFPQFTSTIVSFGALFSVITIMINIISLLVARRKNAYVPGNFKAPGGSVLPVLALIILVVCNLSDIIGGGWIIWAYTIGVYIVGLIIYKTSRAGRGQIAA